MEQELTLDISSPLHTSGSYNTSSLRSIPTLIFMCNNTRELQTGCWAFNGSTEHPGRLTGRCALKQNIQKHFPFFLNAWKDIGTNGQGKKKELISETAPSTPLEILGQIVTELFVGL